MSIDDRTTNRSYKLPNVSNFLADDVVRLRDALAAIDADIYARYTKLEVDQLITNLINGAPGALDTLNELADALGDDANFAATVAAQLALKADASNVYSKAESDARYVQGSTQAEMVFIATANQSVFTLATAVINKPSALVTVDGVVQPTSEYSLNMPGTQLTLSEGVPAGTVVRVLALGVASAGAPADDTVTTPKLRDGALAATPSGLAKMADGFFTATAEALAKFADGFLAASAAGRAKMADLFVTTAKIDNGAVTPGKLSTGAPNWSTSGALTAPAGIYSDNSQAAGHSFLTGTVVGVVGWGNRHLWFYNGAYGSEGYVFSEAATGDMHVVSQSGTDLIVHRNPELGAGAPYWRTSTTGGRIRMTTGNLVNFHWNAGFYYNIDNNNYVLINASPSDINLKNIEDSGVSGAIGLVMALNPVRYTYKEDCPIAVSKAPRYGFIAQELQAVLPELVQEAGLPKRVPESPDEEIEDPGTYLRYADDASKQLIAVLTAALQEAVGRIETLETQIAALTGE